MSIKPILFNQEMVRAILDGRKTVTRRLVKLPKYIEKQEKGLYTLFAEGDCYENCHLDNLYATGYIKTPYQIEDTIYVRETWSEWTDGYAYKTPDPLSGYNYPSSYIDKWHPSLHMPKEAARIFLKVTDVRVERLHDIKEEQIIKEGLSPYDDICQDVNWKPTYNDPDSGGDTNLKQGFEILWDSTVKEDWQKFASNPWVWVIEFERCEKPKGWC